MNPLDLYTHAEALNYSKDIVNIKRESFMKVSVFFKMAHKRLLTVSKRIHVSKNAALSPSYRFTRTDSENKDVKIPTGTVKLTFLRESLPVSVIIGKTYLKVDPFEMRERQCYNCGYLGHIAKMCEASKSKSLNYGSSEDCDGGTWTKRCILCGSLEHNARNRDCPKSTEYKKAINIAGVSLPLFSR